VDVPLRNPSELASRLGLAHPERLLFVDAPDSLVALAGAARAGRPALETARGEALRAVKDTFDGILIWREERSGSQSVLSRAVKRLAPGGLLWIVVALRKVMGPKTRGAQRLDREDLEKAFSKDNLAYDGEVRVTAWHTAHRFKRN
jgi:hypothetical protein